MFAIGNMKEVKEFLSLSYVNLDTLGLKCPACGGKTSDRRYFPMVRAYGLKCIKCGKVAVMFCVECEQPLTEEAVAWNTDNRPHCKES
jgi:rRNA maturation protein Nop10